MAALRDQGLQDEIKLVSYYYTPGMHQFVGRGSVAMAPTDQMIIQARISIDQAVRILEGKPSATGGRPEFNDTGRMIEHVQPVAMRVTPENHAGLRHHHDARAQGLDAGVQHRLGVRRLRQERD